MSKIPYIDYENDSEGLDSEAKKKSFIKSSLISGGILSIIVVALALSVYFFLLNYREPEGAPRIVFHVLADSFSLTGILGLLFFVLSFFNCHGWFDIFAYPIKSAFLFIFRRKYKEENFPKTYSEYKEFKRSQKREPYTPILISSVIYFLLGILFVIIYFANADLFF